MCPVYYLGTPVYAVLLIVLALSSMDPNESQIVFQNTGDSLAVVAGSQDNTPKLIKWIIRYSRGYVRNETQAQYILFGLVACILIISFLVLTKIGKGTPARIVAPPGRTLIQLPGEPPKLEQL